MLLKNVNISRIFLTSMTACIKRDIQDMHVQYGQGKRHEMDTGPHYSKIVYKIEEHKE